jgi:hypothetical protein
LDEEKLDPSLFTIAVLDHPESYFNEIERIPVNKGRAVPFNLIGSNADLILCGHVHEQLPSLPYLKYNTIFLQAGTSNSGIGKTNSFSFYEFDEHGQILHRTVFSYDDNKPLEWKEMSDLKIDVKQTPFTYNESQELSNL